MKDQNEKTHLFQKVGLEGDEVHILQKKKPTQPQERVVILDILRGFAILGILISNMPYFQSPQIYNDLLVDKIWIHAWDPYIDKLYVALIKGKFYTMFSFLFGLGFILFIQRAERSINKPRILFARRMLVLLGIGIIHAIFIWWGDILVIYALIGFILLFFYKSSPKVLLTWAIGLVTVYNVLNYLLVSLMVPKENAVDTGSITHASNGILENMKSSLNHYGEGTLTEIILQNINDWLYIFPSSMISALFLILPMFLLGAYFGKRSIFVRMNEHLYLFKKIWIWSLIFGFTLQMVKLWASNYLTANPESIYTFWYFVGVTIGDPLVCFFYLTSIVLLFQKQVFKNLFTHISRVGRMALSHYLFQSVICSFIFYNIGLGLYGDIGFGLGLLIALIIYSVQLWFSLIWFKKYQYGPLEWIWRMLTYGSKIRINRGK
ncbi:DUF418 domain-containing protein [Chengkuizengella sediminis]|uniref:DUF418 domain-containing protein n=1 Tax=Chengkuizengella sediminis TaxID=1885917 RepID=UPI001389D2AC|nr:DUF418 domain-containing protein [Chengkuizengella sediminis]NDI34274.1 DUF418 domain-containing protein [Chengkuizengella sediminis]